MKLDRPAPARHCLLVSLERRRHHGDRAMRFGKVGAEFERLPKARNRLFKAVEMAQRIAKIHTRFHRSWADLQGFADDRQSFLALALTQANAAEEVRRVEIERLGAQDLAIKCGGGGELSLAMQAHGAIEQFTDRLAHLTTSPRGSGSSATSSGPSQSWYGRHRPIELW